MSPHLPSQNGVSEHRNHTLHDGTKSVLCHANLPISFWGEALRFVNIVLNRSPTKAVNNMTPFEAWYGTKPDLSVLHVFGCQADVLDQDHLHRKFQLSTKTAIYLGPEENSSAHRLWNPETKRIFRSRNVKFLETRDYVPRISLTNTRPDAIFAPPATSWPYADADTFSQLPTYGESYGSNEPNWQAFEFLEEPRSPHR